MTDPIAGILSDAVNHIDYTLLVYLLIVYWLIPLQMRCVPVIAKRRRAAPGSRRGSARPDAINRRRLLLNRASRRRSSRIIDGPTDVYRLYGQPIYTGLTGNLDRRLREHAKRFRIDRVVVETHPNRAQAAAAEEHAIRTEHPQENIVYNRGR